MQYWNKLKYWDDLSYDLLQQNKLYAQIHLNIEYNMTLYPFMTH